MNTQPFLGHIPRRVPEDYDIIAVSQDGWGLDDAPAVVVPLANEAMLPFVEQLISETMDGRRLSVVSVRAALLAACEIDRAREAA